MGSLILATFDNGNTITTRINASIEEIIAYYEGQVFNIGSAGLDLMATCVKVDILETDSDREPAQLKCGVCGSEEIADFSKGLGANRRHYCRSCRAQYFKLKWYTWLEWDKYINLPEH